jgi:hypothetical protein
MRRTSIVSLLATLALAAPAWAQDDLGDPLAVPDEGDTRPVSTTASSQSGDMESRGLGVGILGMLTSRDFGGMFAGLRTGPIGPAVVYDAGVFHIEGILGFADNNASTEIDLGGRFWYHLHSVGNADFSVGGGLGFATISFDGPGNNSQTVIDLEGGAQLRYFLVDNVGLSVSLGLAILAGDGDGVDLTGDLNGAGGIVYYF